MLPFESPSRVVRRAAKIWQALQTPELIVFVMFGQHSRLGHHSRCGSTSSAIHSATIYDPATIHAACDFTFTLRAVLHVPS